MAQDIIVINHGSIITARAISRAGSCWIRDHIAAADIRLGGVVAIEPRYAGLIVAGMVADGLEVA